SSSAHHLRSLHAKDDEVSVDRRDRACRRIGHVGVGVHHATHGSVETDVSDAIPCIRRESLQCPDLVDHVLLDLMSIHLDDPATEAEQVGQARMRSDANSLVLRQTNCAIHDDGVACMKAACNIRGADDLHQRSVIPDPVGPVALAHVGIDIDLHGLSLLYPSAESLGHDGFTFQEHVRLRASRKLMACLSQSSTSRDTGSPTCSEPPLPNLANGTQNAM